MMQQYGCLKLDLLHTKKTPNWGVKPKLRTRMVPENTIVVPWVLVKTGDFQS
jgi:hypothetical protein